MECVGSGASIPGVERRKGDCEGKEGLGCAADGISSTPWGGPLGSPPFDLRLRIGGNERRRQWEAATGAASFAWIADTMSSFSHVNSGRPKWP